MNRELLSKAFGDMEERYAAEAYRDVAPGDRQTSLEKKKRLKAKRIVSLALAAALLALLGVTAYAVRNGSLLSRFFSSRQQGELSPGQAAYLETESVEPAQSVTVDGYTVTVESAICNRLQLYLVLRIEGPEDVKLDFETGEGSLFFHTMHFTSTGTYERTGTAYGYSIHGSKLPDGDGKDNTACLVLKHYRELNSNDPGFTDGELWNIHLGGLFTRTGQYHAIETLLSDSEWDFAIPLTEASEEAEMIASPVVCKVMSGGIGKEKAVEAEVTSFILRPLGASCEYHILPGYETRGAALDGVFLRMKNGETVPLMERSGSYFDSGSMFYEAIAPIVLDEVESLILPDNVIVKMPDEGRQSDSE